MDTRLLYGIALVVAGVSGWFYYQSGDQARVVVVASGGMDYSARQIRLLQTDPQGRLLARTTADQLQHYTQQDRTRLLQVNSIWYQAGQPDATLVADQADSLQHHQRIQLSGHVHINQMARPNRPAVRVQTESLTAYPNQRRIETLQPVQVHTVQGLLYSQGLTADLGSGQYQFNRIRIQYAPASRS
jgi:lipopolysaccharide export system protein LptC